MTENKAVSLTGPMVILALVAFITVGGLLGLAVATWPKASAVEENKQNEVLAKAVAKLAVKGFLDYEDQMERQFYFDKMAKDIKADFPEIKDIWVVDDKRMVVFSPKEEEIEKVYQLPAGISQDAGEKFQIQPLSSGLLWVSAPVISAKTIIGGLRMNIEAPPAPSGPGGAGLLLIVGLVALIIGIVAPVLVLAGKSKQLGDLKSAAGAVNDTKLNALKAEEAALSAKLESARQQLAQAEQAKAQLSAAEQQMEEMKKQQFEETYRLENLKKEAAELADHIDKRKKILEANPLERQAALTSEDQELVAKIAAHKQEEIKLAQKIELIRKKVVDLDRRIEKRQKEEQEIAERIEARKREEMDLNLKMGS